MAIQMAVIITLGVFGGKKLDELLSLKQPIFTLIFSLVAVFASIYLSIKDFLKKK
jgi:membrane protein DedA with SNARE-associated domain